MIPLPTFLVRGDDKSNNEDDQTKAMVGYGAAAVACLAFGSFAVPIKSARANRIHVDPLVMQTYKTVMCFLTCWILLLFGEQFSFTPWGILSGLFWVPGGTAGIYAVRSPVGLALSQSIWSPLKLLAGFTWGILIFHESVRSKTTAFAAIMLMMFGLCGMSYSAASSYATIAIAANASATTAETPQHLLNETQHEDTEEQRSECANTDSGRSDPRDINDDLSAPLLSNEDNGMYPLDSNNNNNRTDDGVQAISAPDISRNLSETSVKAHRKARRLGYLCAVVDGAYGGSILVPMHFAKAKSEGLGFVISFAIGAMAVLLVAWILRFSYACVVQRSIALAYQSLPGFHFSVMWLPGGLAGLLWSIGNLGSIVCVSNLGEGVGYSIVQSQMLVAGLWGVFYYREVQGVHKVLCWLCCACVTVAGVLLLSHEHVRHS